MKSPSILLLVCLLSFCSWAQVDTLDQQAENIDSLGILNWELINDGFYSSEKQWSLTLGNPESPGYDISTIQSSYRYPRLAVIDTHSFESTITRQPNTDLLYQLGSFTYQRFHLSHRQGIRRNVAAIINVRRSKTGGAFQRMTSEFTKLRAGISMISDDSLSQFDILYHYQRSIVEENGGLLFPEDFELYLFDIPELYSVNLDAATNSYKANHFEGNGKIAITKGFLTATHLDLRTKVGRDRSDFADNLFPSSFYPAIYFDSLITKDSVVVGWIDNYAGLSFCSKALIFGLGATHYYQDYSQNRKVDTIFHNYGVRSFASYANKNLEGSMLANYIISGYNAGNHSIKLNIDLLIDSGIWVYAKGLYETYTPHFGFLNRRTNNSFWSFTNFNLTKESSFKGGIKYVRSLKANLNLDFQQVSNLLYYNANRNLAQFQNSASITGASIMVEYNICKYLNIAPSIRYQSISNTKVLPLPNLIASLNISYKRPILKNRLQAEIGARVWWVNEHTGYGYAPELGSFHVQDSIRSGGYPFVHGYANLYVKRATLGVRVNHATEGLLGYDFDLVSGYPAQPRQVALHLRWTLID